MFNSLKDVDSGFLEKTLRFIYISFGFSSILFCGYVFDIPSEMYILIDIQSYSTFFIICSIFLSLFQIAIRLHGLLMAADISSNIQLNTGTKNTYHAFSYIGYMAIVFFVPIFIIFSNNIWSFLTISFAIVFFHFLFFITPLFFYLLFKKNKKETDLYMTNNIVSYPQFSPIIFSLVSCFLFFIGNQIHKENLLKESFIEVENSEIYKGALILRNSGGYIVYVSENNYIYVQNSRLKSIKSTYSDKFIYFKYLNEYLSK